MKDEYPAGRRFTIVKVLSLFTALPAYVVVEQSPEGDNRTPVAVAASGAAFFENLVAHVDMLNNAYWSGAPKSQHRMGGPLHPDEYPNWWGELPSTHWVAAKANAETAEEKSDERPA